MADKREQILAQLEEVLKAVIDGGEFKRNVSEINNDGGEAIVLLDADEQIAQDKDIAGRGRKPEGAIVLELVPEISIAVREKAAKVGTALNTLRAKVIKAVMTDATLKSLCHEMRYEGFTSALAVGRAMEGQGRLTFTFVYVLRVNEL